MLIASFRAITVVAALAPQAVNAALPLIDSYIPPDVHRFGDRQDYSLKMRPEGNPASMSGPQELSFETKADWKFCSHGALVNIKISFLIEGLGISTMPDDISLIQEGIEKTLAEIKTNSNAYIVQGRIDTDEEVKTATRDAALPIAQEIFNSIVITARENDMLRPDSEMHTVEVSPIFISYGATPASIECGAGGMQHAGLEHHRL